QAIDDLASRGQRVCVRVNGLDTGLTGDDLEAIACANLESVMLPKVESVDDIRTVDILLSHFEHKVGAPDRTVKIVASLETAPGLRAAYEILGSSPRVGTCVGSAGKGGDANRSLGYVWSQEGTETVYLRQKLVMDAKAAGVRFPMIASWFDIGNLEAMEVDSRRNRAYGFSGQVVIHPSHVEIVNRVFTPDKAEIDYYRGLIDAMREAEAAGAAAVTYQGMMVDYAMVKMAEDMIAFADSIGIG
ncbi:MAG TPA: aldolase/citrate lyase family protein, partial [Dehalococcoidia bacterium]|nr:aldolase/citrate lyase family protein [Dehalococcoidia bacterium]